jgi:hypothetical protein
LKLVEQGQPTTTNVTAMIRTILADSERKFAQSVTNKDPKLARLAAIAGSQPIFTNDASLDLQTLRAEQAETDAQQSAKERLAAIQASKAQSLAYGSFSSRADSFLKSFENHLSVLAAQVGDHITSSYVQMPPSVITNINNYATIQLRVCSGICG